MKRKIDFAMFFARDGAGWAALARQEHMLRPPPSLVTKNDRKFTPEWIHIGRCEAQHSFCIVFFARDGEGWAALARQENMIPPTIL